MDELTARYWERLKRWQQGVPGLQTTLDGKDGRIYQIGFPVAVFWADVSQCFILVEPGVDSPELRSLGWDISAKIALDKTVLHAV